MCETCAGGGYLLKSLHRRRSIEDRDRERVAAVDESRPEITQGSGDQQVTGGRAAASICTHQTERACPDPILQICNSSAGLRAGLPRRAPPRPPPPRVPRSSFAAELHALEHEGQRQRRRVPTDRCPPRPAARTGRGCCPAHVHTRRAGPRSAAPSIRLRAPNEKSPVVESVVRASATTSRRCRPWRPPPARPWPRAERDHAVRALPVVGSIPALLPVVRCRRKGSWSASASISGSRAAASPSPSNGREPSPAGSADRRRSSAACSPPPCPSRPRPERALLLHRAPRSPARAGAPPGSSRRARRPPSSCGASALRRARAARASRSASSATPPPAAPRRRGAPRHDPSSGRLSPSSSVMFAPQPTVVVSYACEKPFELAAATTAVPSNTLLVAEITFGAPSRARPSRAARPCACRDPAGPRGASSSSSAGSRRRVARRIGQPAVRIRLQRA